MERSSPVWPLLPCRLRDLRMLLLRFDASSTSKERVFGSRPSLPSMRRARSRERQEALKESSDMEESEGDEATERTDWERVKRSALCREEVQVGLKCSTLPHKGIREKLDHLDLLGVREKPVEPEAIEHVSPPSLPRLSV